MGFGFLCSMLVLSLFFSRLSCQQPNTDGFFISEFLKKMGFNSSNRKYNFSAPVCSWQGVFCGSDGEHVIEFFASDLDLAGSIPDNTIGKLSKVQSMDLSNNRITDFSADFWGLGSLKSLNLSNNQISGPLRNDIANFGLLKTLDISANNFSGQIPASISSLTSLKVLKLDRNRFENIIPSGLLTCQYLILIDFSSNRLIGSLPDGFGSAFPKLKSLNLAGNEITGTDSDFSGMMSLTSLNISGNLFKGSAMKVFKGQMEVIDLSRNQFYGYISQVHFNSSYNWSHLVYLDLSENQLSGEIFHIFNQAHNLKHLNLADNPFSRQDFPQIKLLLGLQYLNLSKTSLIHEIPAEISHIGNLNSLDLSYNHLTGRIPPLSVKNLQLLDVSHNNLTGEVPFLILEKLSSMEKFNFSYNNLTFCSLKIPPEILQAAFIGSSNSCPIAANLTFVKRKESKRDEMKLALVLTISVMFVFVGLLLLAFGCRRKSRGWVVKQPSYREEQNVSGPFSFQTDSTTWVADVKQATLVPVVIFEKPLSNLTFADLLSATSNFDRGTLLAEGKFGPVYRGFLPGGIHVAVKVLVHGSTLTDGEAAKELENLGRIKHPNLVPLTGYCLAGDQRIAIYDYMENGTLQNLLHDLPLGLQTTEDWSLDTWEEDNNGIESVGSDGSLTTWKFRHQIALGTARALAFLHHGCSPAPIIHRDIKASSVYIDYNLEPRLSDFGLAKVFGNGLVEEISRCSPGYTPPEFSLLENDSPTPKSDVYCFGVVLFELLTGKKPVGDDYPEEREANLVTWVRGLVRKNQGLRAIDPKIRYTGPDEQMEEALKIGYLCTADIPAKRPSTQQIVGLLKDIEPINKRARK